MSDFYFVYYLLDPDTLCVRYVGVSKDPAARLAQHLIDDTETHKTHWIRSVLNNGKFPTIKIKCVVEELTEAFRIEIALISILRNRGESLTNTTSGGEGGGFAFLDPARLQEICSMGGKKGGLAAQAKVTAEQRRERALKSKQTHANKSEDERRADTQQARLALREKRQQEASLYKLVQLVTAQMRRTPERLYEKKREVGLKNLAKTWTMPVTEKQREARRNNMRATGLAYGKRPRVGRKCLSGCRCSRHNRKPFTDEHCARISASKKGTTAWNKGLTLQQKLDRARLELIKLNAQLAAENKTNLTEE